MSDDERRRAYEQSRTTFLARQAKEREVAAEAVMRERMFEIESGVAPESLLEMELLEKRAGEVAAARNLLMTAEEREEMNGLSDHHHLGGRLKRQREIVPDGVRDEASWRSGTSTMDANTVDAGRVVGDGAHFAEVDREEAVQAERAKRMEGQREHIAQQRKSLPIFQVRESLVKIVRDNRVVVIVGETGSGKTTQLLQYLYEEGMTSSSSNSPSGGGEDGKEADAEPKERKLVCTQPRRIAAVSVAERVATEVGCRCGSTVGYNVRFDNKSGPLTRILFVTDGMMLKEFASDPNLDEIAAIMIDEAHERSLNTDILLGLLKDVLRRNKTIKVIVASATINADKFSDFFDGAPIFTVAGRTFPVEISYLSEPVADYVAACAEAVVMLHATKPIPGDILVFLPGQEQIEGCAGAIHEHMAKLQGQLRQLVVLPIYSSLPPQEQQRIYQRPPPNCRKVVIATNIAETSITIDGIVYVVDSGLCKQDFFNARTLVEELRVVPTSQASAKQRTGRAGRTQAGECFRLYTSLTMKNEFPPETVPEILRSSTSAVVLQLKALGINDLMRFEFIDPPSESALVRALEHLFLLGATTRDGRLTRTGLHMSAFPMDPSLSKCLVAAGALGCARHMAIAAAMLSIENSIFYSSRDPKERKAIESARNKMFAGGNGDVYGYVRLFESWMDAAGNAREFARSHFINHKSLMRARDIFDQILRTYDRVGIEYVEASRDALHGGMEDDMDPHWKDRSRGVINAEALTKAIIAGFFMNVARLGVDQRSYSVVRPLGRSVTPASGGGIDDATGEIHPSSYLHRAGQFGDSGGGGGGKKAAAGEEEDSSIPPILRERPPLVVYIQLRLTTKRYMIHVTAIPEVEWVLAVAKKKYFTKEELEPPKLAGRRYH